jgi:hypothetical protein
MNKLEQLPEANQAGYCMASEFSEVCGEEFLNNGSAGCLWSDDVRCLERMCKSLGISHEELREHVASQSQT